MAEEQGIHRLGMVCRHGEEGVAAADAEMARAREIMATPGEIAVDATDATFLTCVVQWLWWEHSAEITGLYTDQWSAVKAEVTCGDLKGRGCYVECDLVEDGLAAAVVWFSENGKAAGDDGEGVGERAADPDGAGGEADDRG